MNPSISVFGLGYVGTVTAACLAHKGHNVIGVDSSPGKVEAMQSGRSPIVEPNVSDLISQSHAAKHLHATSDSAYAVVNSDISFLCVGTPSLRNGKLDLGHIEPVCRDIGQVLKKKNGSIWSFFAALFYPEPPKPLLFLLSRNPAGKNSARILGSASIPSSCGKARLLPIFWNRR